MLAFAIENGEKSIGQIMARMTSDGANTNSDRKKHVRREDIDGHQQSLGHCRRILDEFPTTFDLQKHGAYQP